MQTNWTFVLPSSFPVCWGGQSMKKCFTLVLIILCVINLMLCDLIVMGHNELMASSRFNHLFKNTTLRWDSNSWFHSLRVPCLNDWRSNAGLYAPRLYFFKHHIYGRCFNFCQHLFPTRFNEVPELKKNSNNLQDLGILFFLSGQKNCLKVTHCNICNHIDIVYILQA